MVIRTVLMDELITASVREGCDRVLNLAALDGRPPGKPARTGGERQTLPTPGAQQVFTAPAVWHNFLFVADGGGTCTLLRGSS